MARPVAVITGASRGIGKQLAVDFAREGYDIACLARSSSDAPSKLPGTIEETARAVEAAGGRALAIALDVRDEAQVADSARQVYETFGRCDVLINNAAVAVPGPTLENTTRAWRLAVDVNINGPFYFTYYYAPKMREAGQGRIINISSAASVFPAFGRISYTATKRALEAMGEGFAHELAPAVAVNCIRLELQVWTEGYAYTLGESNKAGFEDPVVMSDACLWLAKQPLDYTGHVLTIAEMREMGAVRGVTPAG